MIEKAQKLHTLINTDARIMFHQGGRRNNSLRTDVDYIMDVAQNVKKIVHSGLVFEVSFTYVSLLPSYLFLTFLRGDFLAVEATLCSRR